MSSERVVRAWLSAFDAGDLDAARSLCAPEAIFHVVPPHPMAADLLGLDAFLAWYGEKRRTMRQRGYTVDAIVATADYAVARFVLAGDEPHRRWYQLAVYRVRDDRIAEAWAFEDAEGPASGSQGSG